MPKMIDLLGTAIRADKVVIVGRVEKDQMLDRPMNAEQEWFLTVLLEDGHFHATTPGTKEAAEQARDAFLKELAQSDLQPAPQPLRASPAPLSPRTMKD